MEEERVSARIIENFVVCIFPVKDVCLVIEKPLFVYCCNCSNRSCELCYNLHSSYLARSNIVLIEEDEHSQVISYMALSAHQTNVGSSNCHSIIVAGWW